MTLRGRVDGRGRNRVKRTLREGRERPDLLDLVSEELDAEGIATCRREDVDDPAPDRQLASLLDAIDAEIPGVG